MYWNQGPNEFETKYESYEKTTSFRSTKQIDDTVFGRIEKVLEKGLGESRGF